MPRLPNTLLGSSWLEVADRLGEIVRRATRTADLFNKRASRLDATAVWPENEYDFQNLIALVLRPWIPSLQRETVAVTFAGQDKLVDFAASNNRLLIEAKHMTKASQQDVMKTLDELGHFYKSHPNVRLLLFLVLIEADVKVDEEAAASSFTHTGMSPFVVTSFIRNAATAGAT